MCPTEGEGPIPEALAPLAVAQEILAPLGSPRTAEQERIQSGPLIPTLIRLAAPVFVSMLLYTLFNVVDAIWVGRLGPAPLAAVTTSMFASWILMGVAQMISGGLTAVVARHVGAGEARRADHSAAQGLLLAVVFAVIFAASAREAAPALFRFLGTTPEVADAGRRFLGPLLFFCLPFFLSSNLEAILRAHGDTRTPMVTTSVAVLLNLVLDPPLIFGWGPIPAMGVGGAALATIIAQSLNALLLGILVARRRVRFPHLAAELRGIDLGEMVKLLRIGVPTAFGVVLFSLVYLFLSRVAARLGTDELAILGVGNRLESLCYLSTDSLSIAAATMVGQNLGARNVARAREVGRQGSVVALCLASALGLVYFFWGRELFGLFVREEAVRVEGGLYMRVLALSQPLMGVEILLSGVFVGAGYTLAPTWISSVISVLRIPLAILFAVKLGFGLAGLAWVITLTCIVRGMLMYGLYVRGRWVLTPL